MKRIKKLVSIMLAMVMVLAMTMTAFATGGETPDPNAPQTPTDIDRTFKLFQIFTGDPETNAEGAVTGTLANVKWGSSAVLPEGATVGSAVSDDVLEILTKLPQGGPDSNDRTQLDTIQQYVDFQKPVTVGEGQPVQEGNSYKYTGLTPGYYLIEDVTAEESITGDNTTRSLYVVRVTNGELVFAPKVSGVPTPDKSVQDKNDSETNAADPTWDKSADYDIGDTIPYEIKATLPDATAMARYTTYKLTFEDTFSAGLDYTGVTDIKLNGTSIMDLLTVDTNYTLVYDETSRKLTVTFNDVKAAPINAAGGAVLSIEYTAVLNEDANVGSAGNENTLVLRYPNDPNYNGDPDEEPTGTTPPVTAIVFTFKAVVDKVDDNNQPLTGAGFTLDKWKETVGEDGTGTGTYDWVELGTLTVNEADTQFTFNGLDDGLYRLRETTTPNGYNTMADIYFKVVATHDADKGDSSALTELKIYQTDAQGNVTAELTDKNFTIINEGDSNMAGGQTPIQNNKGSLLPSTGGIGTTIFYVVGGILVIGAGILLVTKRRMRAQ